MRYRIFRRIAGGIVDLGLFDLTRITCGKMYTAQGHFWSMRVTSTDSLNRSSEGAAMDPQQRLVGSTGVRELTNQVAGFGNGYCSPVLSMPAMGASLSRAGRLWVNRFDRSVALVGVCAGVGGSGGVGGLRHCSSSLVALFGGRVATVEYGRPVGRR